MHLRLYKLMYEPYYFGFRNNNNYTYEIMGFVKYHPCFCYLIYVEILNRHVSSSTYYV